MYPIRIGTLLLLNDSTAYGLMLQNLVAPVLLEDREADRTSCPAKGFLLQAGDVFVC